MSVEDAPATTIDAGGSLQDDLDAEDATIAAALAEVEAGRAARVAAVDADEAVLKAARVALWEVSRAGPAQGDPVRAGPHGAYHVAESEAAARQRTLDQRTAAVALEAAERAAGESRRAWVAGERRRSDLLMARARLGQQRAQLERDQARRAAAAPTSGDALRAIKRRLGLGG